MKHYKIYVVTETMYLAYVPELDLIIEVNDNSINCQLWSDPDTKEDIEGITDIDIIERQIELIKNNPDTYQTYKV